MTDLKEENNDETIQSQLIKLLIKKGMIKDAKEICKNFPDSMNIQSQLIRLLISEGDYESAKKICERFKDNTSIQSQLIKLLIEENYLEAAKQICEMYKEIASIQSQLVTIYLLEGDTKSAKAICEMHKENGPIQSKLVKILLDEGDIESAKKICEEFKDYEPIQSKYIKILIGEGEIEKAKRVCERFKDNATIQLQLIKILIGQGDIESAKEICKRFKKDLHIQNQFKILLMKDRNIYYEEHQVHEKKETIGDVLAQELSQLQSAIEKINQDELKTTCVKDLYAMKEISKQTYDNIRAKMQLVILFMKYGMRNIAEKKLVRETEIYDEVLRLILFRGDNPEYDLTKLKQSQMVSGIKKAIIEAGGDIEYANTVISHALEIYEKDR